ncbi:hypothetical protein TNCV_415431 [Trichonephila clavipes]|nr:hypothetical protein TNCV_415431 [Trichonephila clavipes]
MINRLEPYLKARVDRKEEFTVFGSSDIAERAIYIFPRSIAQSVEKLIHFNHSGPVILERNVPTKLQVWGPIIQKHGYLSLTPHKPSQRPLQDHINNGLSLQKQSYRNFRLTESSSVTQMSRPFAHVRKTVGHGHEKLLHVARHAKHHVSHVLKSRFTDSNDTCGSTHGDLSPTAFSPKVPRK